MEPDVVVTSLRLIGLNRAVPYCDLGHITVGGDAVTICRIALRGPESHAPALNPFPGVVTLGTKTRDFRRSKAEIEQDIRTLLTGRNQ